MDEAGALVVGAVLVSGVDEAGGIEFASGADEAGALVVGAELVSGGVPAPGVVAPAAVAPGDEVVTGALGSVGNALVAEGSGRSLLGGGCCCESGPGALPGVSGLVATV